ncbi:MAG: DUF485 domain-containing protein [Gluconacetobacter diazotrophicus]|nr:DUF485 domain-containing protein [Gluconacetobacter diazotrophicus]
MDSNAGLRLPGHPDQAAVARTLADPAFRDLVRERGRTGAIVVGATVVMYFGYILLLAFAPGLMHERVTTEITAGFPLGLGVMVITFGLVAFYVRRSSARFDPLIARLRGGAGR